MQRFLYIATIALMVALFATYKSCEGWKDSALKCRNALPDTVTHVDTIYDTLTRRVVVYAPAPVIVRPAPPHRLGDCDSTRTYVVSDSDSTADVVATATVTGVLDTLALSWRARRRTIIRDHWVTKTVVDTVRVGGGLRLYVGASAGRIGEAWGFGPSAGVAWRRGYVGGSWWPSKGYSLTLKLKLR